MLCLTQTTPSSFTPMAFCVVDDQLRRVPHDDDPVVALLDADGVIIQEGRTNAVAALVGDEAPELEQTLATLRSANWPIDEGLMGPTRQSRLKSDETVQPAPGASRK